MTGYRAGKIPTAALERLLERHVRAADGLIVPPGVGRDAALVEVGGGRVVAAADPITFASAEIGGYAVHVNANDVVCLGARPRWFLAVVLLPESGTDRALVDSILAGIAESCAEVGASLCGGHTEVTPGLSRPIVAGTMLGELLRDEPVRPESIHPGDIVVLTKGIAIEGTAILAVERAAELDGRVPGDLLRRAAAYLRDPGLSVAPEGTLAVKSVDVHALHDPTEGGLAAGLRELAHAGGVGLDVDHDAVTVRPETRAICEALQLDPLGLLASGALLVVVPPGEEEALLTALEEARIEASVIGTVTEAGEGLRLIREDGPVPLPDFEQDELARLLEEGG